MLKVILRQEAIDDLSNIWEYTMLEWSISQADYYYQKLKNTCEEIGRNPNLGRNYPNINRHIFGLKTEKHIIFYHQIDIVEIEVIRILHEKMDLKNRIND